MENNKKSEFKCRRHGIEIEKPFQEFPNNKPTKKKRKSSGEFSFIVKAQSRPANILICPLCYFWFFDFFARNFPQEQTFKLIENGQSCLVGGVSRVDYTFLFQFGPQVSANISLAH